MHQHSLLLGYAMNHKTIAVLLATLLVLAACESEKIEVLKSPCVGLAGSPCGPKRPMNGALNPTSHQPQPVASEQG
jgi:hypothetical protein